MSNFKFPDSKVYICASVCIILAALESQDHIIWMVLPPLITALERVSTKTMVHHLKVFRSKREKAAATR